jgi:hypothetical protein
MMALVIAGCRIWGVLLRGRVYLPLILIVNLLASHALADDKTTDDPGFFFEIPGASDCAFDESRDRLYVTTGKQLVVVDTKERTTIESIDLLGGVRSCDISPNSEYLAIAPIEAQFLYWIELEGLEINQVRFSADSSESGVYDLCVGSDGSVVFSMTYAGSGGVKLRRFDPRTNTVDEVGRVNMDSIVTAAVTANLPPSRKAISAPARSTSSTLRNKS